MAISALAFSKDGRRLVSASPDGSIKLWDPLIGQELLHLANARPVQAVALSGDGRRLAAGGGRPVQGEITVWQAAQR